MRNVVLAAIVAFAVFGPIPGHAQGMTTAQPSEEQRVLAVEDEYIAAEVSRDEAALRRLVDDRFAFNSSKGTITGKDAFHVRQAAGTVAHARASDATKGAEVAGG
jgi:hypothetical protein